MNKQRRAEIEKALELLEQAQGLLSDAASEEQDYYDNMPESFQSGERGDRAQEAATALGEACDNIEAAIDAARGAAE